MAGACWYIGRFARFRETLRERERDGHRSTETGTEALDRNRDREMEGGKDGVRNWEGGTENEEAGSEREQGR